MKKFNKFRAALLGGLALAGMAVVAVAQIASPFPYFGMVMDGQPVTSVPFNQMVAGPAASQLQDQSKVAAPAYASGGCTTTPAITGSAYLWTLTNGASGCSGSTLTLTMPAAATKWVCTVHDVTSPTTTVVEQSAAASTTSVVLTNYTRTTGAVLTWVASDVLIGECHAG